jgi:twitching motility two-component system response regulator PilH
MSIRHILVIDDSATERLALQELLSRKGYVVTCAENAESALKQIALKRPDLILMDVVMPGQNGFQLTRQLTRAPETQTIPIIICTSKDQQTDRIWGLRQGARDYLTKPVNAAELLEKITALR